jgi:predicted PilT family ATPase
MVIPVTEQAEKKAGVLKLVAEAVKEYFYQYTERPVVEMMSAHKATVTVPKNAMAPIIGTGGSNIKAIEKELGISIDLREGSGKDSRDRDEDHFQKGKKDKRGWKGKDEGRGSTAVPERHPNAWDEREDDSDERGKTVSFDVDINKRDVTVDLGKLAAGKTVTFLEGSRPMFTTTVGRDGRLVLDKNTANAIAVAYAVKHDALQVRIV